MGLLHVIRIVPSPTYYEIGPKRPPPALSSVGTIAGWQDELAFAALCRAYEASGGIARGDELGRLLADHGPASFISMAKLLADDDLFGFEWSGSLRIPMFQFVPESLTVRSGARRVRAELGNAFDGWTASAWFVEPNVWLDGRRPLDVLESDVTGVLHAARVDRFVAAG